MNRWQIGSLNYERPATDSLKQEQVLQLSHPWQVVSPNWTIEYFATHAEAIAYADKQARRTT